MSNEKIKAFFAVLTLLVISMVAVVVSVQAEEIAVRDVVDVIRNETKDLPDYENQGNQIGVQVIEIKINGNQVENGDTLRENFQRGDVLDITVRLQAFQSNENVEIEAEINGDDHFRIADVSDVFRVRDNNIYTKTLKLKIPEILEAGSYKLRLTVADRDSAVRVYSYNLELEEKRHMVELRDVTFSPEREVKAGRALLAVARITNMGSKEEDNIKVTVSIPDLQVSASDYVDSLETDESISSEELYLRIPDDAKSGKYNVNVMVEYDEGFEQVTGDYDIYVVGSSDEDEPAAETEKTVITVGADLQSVEAGQGGAIYPLSITNNGKQAKSYTVSVKGAESFADVEISPSTLVTVEGGKTQQVFVYVSAKQDATVGPKGFSVEIKSGEEVLQNIPLTANVQPSAK